MYGFFSISFEPYKAFIYIYIYAIQGGTQQYYAIFAFLFFQCLMTPLMYFSTTCEAPQTPRLR